MGRLIVVVIVLVVIALLINRYLRKEEAAEPDEPATQEQPEVDVEEPAAPTADEGETPAPPTSATPDVLIPEEQPTSGTEDAAEEAEDAAEETASRGTGDLLLRNPARVICPWNKSKLDWRSPRITLLSDRIDTKTSVFSFLEVQT